MDKVLNPGGFNSTHGFFLLQDQLNITLLQEKSSFKSSRCGGSQGNCLGTDNQLGEDVVLLNVEN